MLPVLSKEKLFKLAPSIFTQASSHKTSNKYAPISTEQIIDKLMSEGFFPTWATQTKSLSQESKAGPVQEPPKMLSPKVTQINYWISRKILHRFIEFDENG